MGSRDEGAVKKEDSKWRWLTVRRRKWNVSLQTRLAYGWRVKLSTERFWEPLENKIVKRSEIVKLTKLSNKTNGHCLQFVTNITDRLHTLWSPCVRCYTGEVHTLGIIYSSCFFSLLAHLQCAFIPPLSLDFCRGGGKSTVTLSLKKPLRLWEGKLKAIHFLCKLIESFHCLTLTRKRHEWNIGFHIGRQKQHSDGWWTLVNIKQWWNTPD